MNSAIFLVFAGAAGGFMSAGFGVGGGAFMLPLLLFYFRGSLREYVPLSLAAILPISLISATLHLIQARPDINYLLLLLVLAGSLTGTRAGVRLIHRIPARLLSALYILILIIAALRLSGILPATGKAVPESVEFFLYPLVGLIAGLSSALFGIGGGIIMVPAFTLLFRMPAQESVIHSLLIIIITSGSALRLHLKQFRDTKIRSFLPAMIFGGFLGSMAGLLLSTHIEGHQFTGAFAVILMVMSIRLAIQLLRSKPE